eukprot:848003-Pelagomonas_calceolata.AAC.1
MVFHGLMLSLVGSLGESLSGQDLLEPPCQVGMEECADDVIPFFVAIKELRGSLKTLAPADHMHQREKEANPQVRRSFRPFHSTSFLYVGYIKLTAGGASGTLFLLA